MTFYWRGRLRDRRPRGATPLRPVVRVRETSYEALRAFARQQGLTMKAALENALAGLPQRRASNRGPGAR